MTSALDDLDDALLSPAVGPLVLSSCKLTCEDMLR